MLKVGEPGGGAGLFPLLWIHGFLYVYHLFFYIYNYPITHPNENFLSDVSNLERKEENGKQLSVTWASLVQPGTAGRLLAEEWELGTVSITRD